MGRKRGARSLQVSGPPPQPSPASRRGSSRGVESYQRRSMLLRADQLEADIAFELVGRFLARMRIVLALAGLAQVAGDQQRAGGVIDRFIAALLDEDARHRCFALVGGEVLALPAVAAESRIEEVAHFFNAWVRIRYQRSSAVNCSAVFRSCAKKPAIRVRAARARSCSPWLEVMVTVVRPAWLVCRPMAWSSKGRLVMASR